MAVCLPARQRYEKALEILREISAKPEIARCQAGLGRIAMSQGDLQLARRYLGASLALSQSSGSRIGMIRGIEAFAALAAEEGDPGAAVRLTAAAAALRQEADLPAAPASSKDRVLAAADDLGEDSVGELWAECAALPARHVANIMSKLGVNSRTTT